MVGFVLNNSILLLFVFFISVNLLPPLLAQILAVTFPRLVTVSSVPRFDWHVYINEERENMRTHNPIASGKGMHNRRV